ncbi:hypothetical protein DL96DRAFT_1800295, partial [Flagelloscypha sp. PMI_526]
WGTIKLRVENNRSAYLLRYPSLLQTPTTLSGRQKGHTGYYPYYLCHILCVSRIYWKTKEGWFEVTMNPFTSSFPSELLLLIFESACEDNRIEPERRLVSQIPALSLSQVCRSFRSLATSSWRLWSNVTIDIGTGISYCCDSHTSEDDFIMTKEKLLPIFYEWLDGHSVRLTIVANSSWPFSALDLYYLFPGSWKISSLTMTENIYSCIIKNEFHLDEHITSLQIVENARGQGETSLLPRGHFTHLCNLEVVDLGPLDLSKFDFSWHQLRVIRSEADLRSLTLLASRCTRLTSLTIYETNKQHSSSIPDKLTFQYLTELRAWLPFETPDLIRYFHTPSLTTLLVHGYENELIFRSPACDGLLKFLEYSSPALQTFKFHGTRCSEAELLNLLRRMPGLRTLHFWLPLVLGDDDIPTNLHDLSSFLADPMNLPELTHLEVHGVEKSSSTNSLIRSINKRKSVEGEMLRVVRLRVTEGFMLDEPHDCMIDEMSHSGFFVMIESEEVGEGSYDFQCQIYDY